jgi:hypothetical protein
MLELMGALADFPERLPAARRRWSAFKRSVREMAPTQPPLWAHGVRKDIYATREFGIFRALATREAKKTQDYKAYHREYMREYMRQRRAAGGR